MNVLIPDADDFRLGRRVVAGRSVERGGGVPRDGASADTGTVTESGHCRFGRSLRRVRGDIYFGARERSGAREAGSMRREEDDDPAKAPDEARSEEMTRSLTTGFGQLDLAPPPGAAHAHAVDRI